MSRLTVDLIRELYDYDPIRGRFTYSYSEKNRKNYMGRIVGTPNQEGYVKTAYKGKAYTVARLIWLHVHGVIEKEWIVYLNDNLCDLRLENLVNVSVRTARQSNLTVREDNVSGYKGVSLVKSKRSTTQTWLAQIKNDEGKLINLGYYKCPKKAHEVYLNAKTIYQPNNILDMKREMQYAA